MSYGMDAKLGLSFQTSYGTAFTSSMHWLEPVGESIGLKKAQLVLKGMRGIYDEGAYQEGANTVEGDVNIEAKAIPLGVLLSATNGLTTVTSSGVYTHTFKPRTADWDGYSAERPFTYHKGMGDTGSAQLYADMNGSGLELSIANGELLTAKMTMVGGTYSQIAAIAASYPTGNALDWSISSVSIAGTARDNIKALTINQSNALEPKLTLKNSKYPSRVKRTGNRNVSVAGTLLFDNQTDLQKFISQTEQRLLVTMKSATEIQSGYYESFTVDIPSMRFTEFPQAVGGAGELEIGFKAMGVYNVGSACAVTYTLVNSKAGY